MKKIIIWLLLIGLVAALAVFAYIKVFSAKHDDPTKKEQIKITASELYRLFSNFEDSATRMYAVRDKAINVSGRISSKEIINNRYTLSLHTGDDMGAIVCEMDSVENPLIKNLNEDDSVNIIGFCNGYLMDVQMFRCKLAK